MFKIEVSVPKDEPVVGVRTTDNRGFTPEELAQQCVEKVILVSDNAHPGIRDHDCAFSKHVEKLDEYYTRPTIRSDHSTVCNGIKDAGHPQLAELIRRL